MELVLGHKYEVIVQSIVPRKGIVVELVDDIGHTEFIHVSRISDKFVSDIGDFVQCGENLIAECVEGLAYPLELSLKHLGLVARNLNRKTNSNNTRRFSNKQTNASSNFRPRYAESATKYVEREILGKSSPTLDEMIEKSNEVLREKMNAKKSRYDRK